VEDRGLEQEPETSEKSVVASSGAAESGAVGAVTESLDPRLRDLTKLWSNLPEVVKAGITAMVRACYGQD